MAEAFKNFNLRSDLMHYYILNYKYCRYADRAKKIKNNAVVNENPIDKLIRELKVCISITICVSNNVNQSPKLWTYGRIALSGQHG